MNYNYTFTTGVSTISSSRNFVIERNIQAPFAGNGFLFDQDVVTGTHTALLSLNSQTLLEEEVIVEQGLNKTYNYVNTGHYYIASGDISYPNIFKFQDISVSGDDLVFYDKRVQYPPFVQEKTNIGGGTFYDAVYDFRVFIQNSREEDIDTFEALEERFSVFFNGQKIVNIDSIDLDNSTGILFAYEKYLNTTEIISADPDIYGTGFVGSQVSYYINGMEQDPSSFLEIYTGITGIKTGVSSYVPLINQEEFTYNL